jgi:hypothetical protein
MKPEYMIAVACALAGVGIFLGVRTIQERPPQPVQLSCPPPPAPQPCVCPQNGACPPPTVVLPTNAWRSDILCRYGIEYVEHGYTHVADEAEGCSCVRPRDVDINPFGVRDPEWRDNLCRDIAALRKEAGL